MIYVKVKGGMYPAEIEGRIKDAEWDGRASKTITFAASHGEAAELFGDGAGWSIVCVEPDGGESEFDNSDYCVAGDITDHRDGTVSVKMGKATELETVLELILRSPLGDAPCEQGAEVQAPLAGGESGV